jgi:hypothetical protein
MKTLALTLLALILPLSAAAQDWESPRMPWGDPDLQGIWNTATLTGLERFDGIDDLVISEEEAHRLELIDAGCNWK